jgi:AcrR family transcriptional regulator
VNTVKDSSALMLRAEALRTARRTEILAAACRCFARDGFHATSMADIIAEAGISAGAVYRYFSSKEMLIAGVVEMTLATADELFDELLAEGAAPSPQETVSRIVEAVMQQTVDHPDLGVDMSRVALCAWAEALRNPEVAGRIAEKFTHARRHFDEVGRRWQAAGHITPDVDPENVGAVMLGIVHAFALQRLLLPGTEPAAYLTGVRALFEPT